MEHFQERNYLRNIPQRKLILRQELYIKIKDARTR